jgi:hypothetical protein
VPGRERSERGGLVDGSDVLFPIENKIEDASPGGAAATAPAKKRRAAGTAQRPPKDSGVGKGVVVGQGKREPSGEVQEALRDFEDAFELMYGEPYHTSTKDAVQVTRLVKKPGYTREGWQQRIEAMARDSRDFARTNFNPAYLAGHGWSAYAQRVLEPDPPYDQDATGPAALRQFKAEWEAKYGNNQGGVRPPVRRLSLVEGDEGHPMGLRGGA